MQVSATEPSVGLTHVHSPPPGTAIIQFTPGETIDPPPKLLWHKTPGWLALMLKAVTRVP